MIEFSIIIPFQTVTPYLFETLSHISKLTGPDFEVILLPDALPPDDSLPANIPGSEKNYSLKIIPTGAVSPAVKRDKGAEASCGRYLAFIDDDAYPDAGWLSEVLPHFSDKSIAGVGGPQITPEQDGFWQKVSGAMFLSPLNGQSVCRYYPCRKSFFVDDWPSVNLIIRKKDFMAVGGFDSDYWPGEDTKLCLDIIEKQNKKIIYEPNAKVFHHRRAGFFKHMKQVGNYGLHRGYFAKRFPATSFRLSYMLPSCFFLFACLGWLLLFAGGFSAFLYKCGWVIYFSAILFSIYGIFIKLKDISIALASAPYIIGTHFWYGFRFLQGFVFVKDLKSKLGR